MLKEKATEIYGELITGKFINSKTLNMEDNLVDNLLYLELDRNVHEYEEFYNMIGYDLVHNIEYEYFYLKKQTSMEEDEQEIDKGLVKEFVLSVCFCRHLLDTKRTLDMLFDPKTGITEDEIESFLKEDKFETIFLASEINTQTNPIHTIFERKNILTKNAKGNYIGTNILRHFVSEQEELGKKIVANDVMEG